MRSLVRAVAVAAAFAIPATTAAPPASAALVCLYWTTRPVWVGGPAGDFYATYPAGADISCAVQTAHAHVNDIVEIVQGR